MFKKKKDNTPKLILVGIGAIATVGGLIVGLTNLKKRKYLEEGSEEGYGSCHHEEECCQGGCCCGEEEIECMDEAVESSETQILTEEEIKLLTK